MGHLYHGELLNNQRVNAMLYHPLMGMFIIHGWTWIVFLWSSNKQQTRPASSRSERFRNPRKKKTTPMIAWSVYSVGGFSLVLGRFKSHTKPPMNPWSMPAYLLENLVMENAPLCGWLKMGVPIGEISIWFPEERSQRLVPQNVTKISNEIL